MIVKNNLNAIIHQNINKIRQIVKLKQVVDSFESREEA